jgi:SAM-dependent methyltransferase
VQNTVVRTKGQDKPFHVLDYYRRYRNEELIKYMPYRSGLRVLDCGCGEGTLLEQLDGRAETPWGIDRVRPQASLDATLHQVSIAREYQLPFGAETFDVVFGYETLCQSGEPVRVLQECARVLRSGGWLITWESRHRCRQAAIVDRWVWMRAAGLTLRVQEPFDYLAYPAVRAMSLVPVLARLYVTQSLTKAAFALDGMLARVPALADKSWHLIVAGQKEDTCND